MLVETASSSHDDGDLDLVLTPEDLSGAGRFIAAHETVEGPLSPGTAEGVEVEVGSGNEETGSPVPLSPSTTGAFGNFFFFTLGGGDGLSSRFFSDGAYRPSPRRHVFPSSSRLLRA